MRRLRLRFKDESSGKIRSSCPGFHIVSSMETPVATFKNSQPRSEPALSYRVPDSMANFVLDQHFQKSIPSHVVGTVLYSLAQFDSSQPTTLTTLPSAENEPPHRKEGEQCTLHVFVFRNQNQHEIRRFSPQLILSIARHHL